MAASVATATLTLAQKHFLSSDVITGTVTVNNTSQYSLRYFTQCGVPFWPEPIYLENGQWIVRPVLRAFSRCASGTADLAPGAQYSFPVNLSTCQVRSTPCSQTLALQLSVGPVGATPYTISTNQVSYTIVPDPTATFEDVSGNRPVIIAQGAASDTLTPTVGLESFTMSPTQTAACSGQGEIVDLLDRAFREAGIQLGGSYSRSDPACVVGVRVYDLASNAARLPDAVQRARTALGNKLESYREEYALESFGDLERAPELAAMSRVRAVTPILGVEVRPQAPPGYDRGILGDEYGMRTPMPRSWADLIFSRRSPMRLTLWQNWAVVGDRPAHLAASVLQIPASVEFRGNNASPPGFRSDLALRIAVDRPQVFVLGAADNQLALQNGLDPTAAAIALAARRAKMVAQLLGMSARYYSLVEAYPPTSIGGERYVYTAGVAMTLAGQNAASWRQARAAETADALPVATPDYVPIAIPDGDDLVAGQARSTVSMRLPSIERLAAIEREVTKRALDEAIGTAVRAAQARHLKLKRLVLLIVSPLDIDGDPFAQSTTSMGQFFALHVRVQMFFRSARA